MQSDDWSYLVTHSNRAYLLVVNYGTPDLCASDVVQVWYSLKLPSLFLI